MIKMNKLLLRVDFVCFVRKKS